MKKEIYSNNAPKPIGPYSQCIKYGNMIFISGQISINPKTNEIITNNISEETKMVMENISSLEEPAPNLITLPIGGAQPAGSAEQGSAESSSSPTTSIPTIHSSDSSNPYLSFAESIYGVLD